MLRPDREKCLKRLNTYPEMKQAKKDLLDFFKQAVIQKAPNSPDEYLEIMSNNTLDMYINCALLALEDYTEEKNDFNREIDLLGEVDEKIDELTDLLTGVWYFNEHTPKPPGLEALTMHLLEYRNQKKEPKPRNHHIDAGISRRLTSGRKHMAYLRGFVTLLKENLKEIGTLKQIKGPIATTVSVALDITDGSVSAETVKDYFKNNGE